MSESDMIFAALHEAGHTIAARYSGLVVDKVTLTPKPVTTFFPPGINEFPEYFSEGDGFRTWKKNHARTLLGGTLAEWKFKLGILQQDMEPREIIDCVYLETMEIGIVGSDGKTYRHDLSRDLEYDSMLADEYHNVKRTIIRKWNQVQGIAAALLSAETLTESQITNILKNIDRIYSVNFLHFTEGVTERTNGETVETFTGTL